MSNKVVVVGGGLAGLSAAHTVLERGGTVVLLDKNPFLGGNSTKATSGINAALTTVQIKQGIPDSAAKFEEDTAISFCGGKQDYTQVPPLVEVLTRNSASAVEWLIEKFNLDLSLVSRLGGHSFPRTHRGKERFPGFTITYALMEKIEEISEKSERARVLTRARVTKLLTEEDRVVGVEYEHEGKKLQERGSVILATGGFAADFEKDSLLQKVRPDLTHLPTTNGDHCTGDGIKMALEIGGNAIDLEHVQVHPTGLVHPDEPLAKVKFLAAEALRGVGGLLLDRHGKRFCDELGRRDYVSGEMNKHEGPFRLVLNSKGAKDIEWHCKHYIGRGLMKHFTTGEGLAKEMGISVETLKETFNKYNEGAKNNKDVFGKKYFDNSPFQMEDQFYVAVVCPVLHYCMGGLEITPQAQVIDKAGKPISGLYATGEVVGGVHGKNRLGGNSLLDCVVFGRVAGDTACRHLLENAYSHSNDRIATIANHLLPKQQQKTKKNESDTPLVITLDHSISKTRLKINPQHNKLSLSLTWDNQPSSSLPTPSTSTTTTLSPKELSSTEKSVIQNVSTPPSLPPPPIKTQEKTSSVKKETDSKQNLNNNKISDSSSKTDNNNSSQNKVFRYEEVSKHNLANDCWVVINGKVLDVTHFLKDHPGGKQSILLYAGKDASEEFNMLHKPNVIDKYAPQTVIGTIDKNSVTKI